MVLYGSLSAGASPGMAAQAAGISSAPGSGLHSACARDRGNLAGDAVTRRARAVTLLVGAATAALTWKLFGTRPSQVRPEAALAGYETRDASAAGLFAALGIFATCIATSIGLMIFVGSAFGIGPMQRARRTSPRRSACSRRRRNRGFKSSRSTIWHATAAAKRH